MSWDGRERRRSTPAERKRWLVSHPPPSEFKALLLYHFTRLPRPVLFLLALGGLLYIAWAETAWRTGVQSHVENSQQGYARLAAVEQLALATATHVKGLGEELRLLREEQKEQRIDQLSFYRWNATRVGDERKAADWNKRLEDVKRD